MSTYSDEYSHMRKPQRDLCFFFSGELPWAFGARSPGVATHLPPPWWDKLEPRTKQRRKSSGQRIADVPGRRRTRRRRADNSGGRK